ncbi:UNVERIFIED_ORG: hypothetical protein QOE_2471, partial [Clostridioides difficile F501]
MAQRQPQRRPRAAALGGAAVGQFHRAAMARGCLGGDVEPEAAV